LNAGPDSPRAQTPASANVKGVGEGVLEYRLDFGPGYRVYFCRDGDVLVILLAGGTRSGSSAISRPRSPLGGLQAAQTIGEVNHGSNS
jgi:putative component of toxin-antitoxin plasmid stabilization module